MKKKTQDFLVILFLILAFLGGFFLDRFLTFLDASKKNQPLTYYLISDQAVADSEVLEGCGGEYLVQYTTDEAGNAEAALKELFSLKDMKVVGTDFTNSLYNSDITPEVVTDDQSELKVNLKGDLISAGTCDDPRIISQITKTVEYYAGARPYEITLNGSATEWKCWGDESGQCN